MGIKIESIGISENPDNLVNSSLELAADAGRDCLKKSRHQKDNIAVVINASSYRDHYFAEPAFATFVQDKLEINNKLQNCSGSRTLAFDLLNGSMAFLNACETIGAMISNTEGRTGLVIGCDANDWPISSRGNRPSFRSVGSAMLLEKDIHPHSGFGSFLFRSYPEHIAAYETFLQREDGKIVLMFRNQSDLEQIYLNAIDQTISQYLRLHQLDLGSFDYIVPPQISSSFITQLADILQVKSDCFIDATRQNGDLFTSSLPFAFWHLHQNGLAKPGKKALIVMVGSGIQVGCSKYNF